MIRLERSMITDLVANVPGRKAIQIALQNAIELEHATIPPYLYALYSLVPGKNDAIAAIIESIVIEEMLHMTLASNVLNAIGGAPVVNKPDFIPTYPGHLPGSVQRGLTVRLAPFSMKQLQTFLDIEEPEDPLVFEAESLVDDGMTIGEFYEAISKAIGRAGEDIFVPGPHNQIGADLMPEAVTVTNVASAQQAITTIVEQGEGTKNSPEEVVGGGYAHYYRFMEIKEGHRLVKNPGQLPPDEQYSYTGDPIHFDTQGVYPIPTNPSSSSYAVGSQAAFENDTFNYTYTSLLNALHLMFNGENDQEQFNRAIGLMMSLKGQAKSIVSGLPNPDPDAGNYVGPSFQYQPTNPEIDAKN